MSEAKGLAALLGALTKKKGDEANTGSSSKARANLREVRSWYNDRYNSVLIQRNFMVIVTVVSVAAVIISVLVVAQITSQKDIEPFVIQVEDRSGIAKVIRPLNREYLSSREAMNHYFIVRYIRAREGYFQPIHEENRKVVRMMSAENVFKAYRWQINPNNEDSPVRWGARGTRRLEIVSILPLETPSGLSGNTVQVRFTVTDEREKIPTVISSKIASMRFDYVDMQITDEERYTNPVGFQVIQYEVTSEIFQESAQ